MRRGHLACVSSVRKCKEHSTLVLLCSSCNASPNICLNSDSNLLLLREARAKHYAASAAPAVLLEQHVFQFCRLCDVPSQLTRGMNGFLLPCVGDANPSVVPAPFDLGADITANNVVTAAFKNPPHQKHIARSEFFISALVVC